MTPFFDTSVLVAAFVEDERRHEVCADVLGRAGKQGVVWAHALAECFSVLTGGRLSVQLSATDAARLLETNIVGRLTVVTLTPVEMVGALRDAERLGIRGGSIYDSLHLAVARKAGADRIFTLNARHFRAFAPDLAPLIRSPGER